MGKIETGARGVKPRVDLRLYRGLDSPFQPPAEVVELVDALASGASGRKPVGVRVPPSAYLLDGWTARRVGKPEGGSWSDRRPGLSTRLAVHPSTRLPV